MSLLQSISFDNAANFTFDSDLIEFSLPLARLKDLIGSSETFFNEFTTKDLFRNVAGSAVGTLSGTASIISERLSINGVSGQWAFNPQGMLGADPNVGCIRIKYIPQYTGNPSVNEFIYEEKESSGRNRIFIYHLISGVFTIEFRSSTGVIQGAFNFPWSPVSGTTYEIELNFDTTIGTQKIYINGVQHGVDLGAIFTRTAAATIASCGSIAIPQHFLIDDIQRFDLIQFNTRQIFH